ncbi:hypothetical protein BDV06DRAFT_221209 [Aspergillus oleicola]
MYATAAVLLDPIEQPAAPEIRRSVGNISQPGISLFVVPKEDTSATAQPKAGGARTIDQDVFVVESVISVLDRGKWVADLDILCIDFEKLSRITKDCDNRHNNDYHHGNDRRAAPDLNTYDCISIDEWDERTVTTNISSLKYLQPLLNHVNIEVISLESFR